MWNQVELESRFGDSLLQLIISLPRLTRVGTPGVEGKVHVADIYARLDPSFAAGDHEGAKAWKVAATPRISFF